MIISLVLLTKLNGSEAWDQGDAGYMTSYPVKKTKPACAGFV